MPFTVPNAENPPTYAGQAVMDASDFTCLAAAVDLTGVSYGASVAVGGGWVVNVAAGQVQFQGIALAVASASVTCASAGAADRRDIIVCSSSGSIYAVTGTPCAIPNWVPQSGLNPPVKPGIPSGCIMLGEIYMVAGAASVSTSMIIDKTAIILTSPRSATANTPATSAAVASVSGSVLASNPKRLKASITNTGGNYVYLALGAAASVSAGIRLAPYGGNWTDNVYTGAYYAIASGGTSNVAIAEV